MELGGCGGVVWGGLEGAGSKMVITSPPVMPCDVHNQRLPGGLHQPGQGQPLLLLVVGVGEGGGMGGV